MAGRHRVVVVAADAVDAGDVAHQLARRECPLLFGVRGNEALDRRVEIEPPAVVQQRGRKRRQRFREGAEPEAHERRDRCPAFDVGPAETFGPDDLAIYGDGHREARQVASDGQLARELPGCRHRVRVPVGGRGGHRRGHGRGVLVNGPRGHDPDHSQAHGQHDDGDEDGEHGLGTDAYRSHGRDLLYITKFSVASSQVRSSGRPTSHPHRERDRDGHAHAADRGSPQEASASRVAPGAPGAAGDRDRADGSTDGAAVLP